MDQPAVFSLRESAKDVLASVVGAAACCYTGQPFDTVKVRMQAQQDRFKGAIDCLVVTVRDEGVTALWKGSTAVLWGMVAENAAAFGVNEQLKRMFPAPPVQPGSLDFSSLSHGMALGAGTGVVTSIVLCPSEVVKTRAQVATHSAKQHGGAAVMSSGQLLMHVWRTRGLVGLFGGLEAQMIRDGPFYAIFFGSYELCVHWLRPLFRESGNKCLGLPHEAAEAGAVLVSGGLAGMFGWGAVMPFDGPKSIIQAMDDARPAGQFWGVFWRVLNERGVKGLYAGFGPAMARAFPANAALFMGYEFVRQSL